MKELEEHVCVKFCCKLGKNFTETFQLLNQAYGEDCMSRTQYNEWFKLFKERRMSVGEGTRHERPSTSTNDDHVGRVLAVIRGNRLLTVREVADDVSLSRDLAIKFLLKNFRCVASVQNSCRVY